MTAGVALDRAAAAYEYGDMNVVVDAVRPIVDGALPAREDERADAWRFLGIGMFLTGRYAGAEAAFSQLLALRPQAHLNPTATRPEAVAFFEDVRRRHAAQARQTRAAGRPFVWNLLPPVGQFQNHDRTRGFVILSLEAASAGAAAASYIWLTHKRQTGNIFADPALARAMKTVNGVSLGVLAATYVVGVIDAWVRSDADGDADDRVQRWSLSFAPETGGAGAFVRLVF